ncbi:hypothetical protein CDAR_85251 [Caerostris darwini]|uniref:Uncharacterized protein n=1 Tax=Caerostris darwini TaxID=1538125 RepID=A0AAV4MZR1_9ARAC|nr:hypothetical protein CDAR_85251 [Caerostris darwini]
MAIKRGLHTELHLLHYSELGDPYFTPFISRPLANGLATVEKHFVYRARIPLFSASGFPFCRGNRHSKDYYWRLIVRTFLPQLEKNGRVFRTWNSSSI